MVKRAVEMEGTVTGEHGVGLIKRDYLQHEVGETTVDTMRRVSYEDSRCRTGLDPDVDSMQVKMALDPLRLLNCDKVVRVEQPTPGELKKW
jgi:D-lactate dehydrogenase (cytochrome)